MARILNIKCKLCRREGKKLFLKGGRCYSGKCPIEKKGAVPPGVHGQKRLRKLSDFGVQLREKQKLKRTYGITEKQLKNYFLEAKRQSTRKRGENMGGTGEYLLKLLELRLDNIIFRAGLTASRSVARQIINHGHMLVDGKKINIPSYQVKINQVMTFSVKSLNMPIIKANLEKKIVAPKWLEKKGAAIKLVRMPKREEIDPDINESLIIEFYSR